jgi:hypothetical protein
MLKKNCLVSMMLILGLSASIAVAKTPSRLTLENFALIFPEATTCENVQEIESGIQYGEAWHEGSWETTEEFLGYVFFKTLTHEKQTLDILVGVTRAGAIARVKIKGVDERFLAQFRGKTAQDNFEIAQTPEDLLYIPTKIRALQGNLPLSASIAQSVKEIVSVASHVIKK